MIQYRQPVTQSSIYNNEQNNIAHSQMDTLWYKITNGCYMAFAFVRHSLGSHSLDFRCCYATAIKRNIPCNAQKRLMYVYFKRLHWTKSILPCWLQICWQRFEFLPQSTDWRLVDRKLCASRWNCLFLLVFHVLQFLLLLLLFSFVYFRLRFFGVFLHLP